MKIGLVADPHMNIFRRNNTFFSHVESAFDMIVNKCTQENVEMIIILGDLFHTKHYISTEALIKANDIVARLTEKWPIYIITGNHDLIKQDDNSVNALDIYKYFKNVKVISEYQRIFHGKHSLHFVPFHMFDIPKIITSIQTDENDHYLFGHFGIKHFTMMYTSDDREIADWMSEVTASDLTKFKHVFLGHFHGHNTQDNITYVGSPFQSCHGDEHSQHGFVIFDIENNTYKFYPNSDTPQFITRDFTKENIKELLNYKNHYIRFLINKHVSKELLVAVKTKLLVNNYDVEYKFNISTNSIAVPELEGWDENVKYSNPEELITEFINQIRIPQEFNKEKLLETLFK